MPEPSPTVDTPPTADPHGTETIGSSLELLASLSHYNQWILEPALPYLRGRVLEIGAGIGNLTELIAQHAREVVGIEPVAAFAQQAQRRFDGRAQVRIDHAFLEDLPEPTAEADCFDVVISFNVVEHIQDDVDAHRRMAGQLRPGGYVISFVPAGPWAHGRLDEALGHYRRYTRSGLRRVMTEAGLQWVQGRYHNRVGLLGWWFNSVVLGKTAVPGDQASRFNRIVPALRRIERVLALPFGQSVMGIARRPAD